MVDVEDFLTRYGISYRDTGPNVAKGHVVVRCPYCGADDPSEHMGISIENGMWGCWRNSSHRGKNFSRLVAALLGIPLTKAQSLVGEYDYAVDEFDQVRQRLLGTMNVEEQRKTELPFPPYTHVVDSTAPRKYRDFLLHVRGWGNSWEEVAEKYELCYTEADRWADRLLIPCYYEKRRVTYVGRLVEGSLENRFHATNRPRYKAVEKQEAAITTSQIVYRPPGEDLRGHSLIVTEGPLDAINIDRVGREFGVRSTCIFGLSYTENQIYDLLQLAEQFERVWVMFDPGTQTHAYDFSEQLVSVSPGLIWMHHSLGDPGSLSRERIVHFVDRVLCEEGRTITLDKNEVR